MNWKILAVPHPLLGALVGCGIGGIVGGVVEYIRSANGPRPRSTGGFTEPLDPLFGVLGDAVNSVVGAMCGGLWGLIIGGLLC